MICSVKKPSTINNTTYNFRTKKKTFQIVIKFQMEKKHNILSLFCLEEYMFYIVYLKKYEYNFIVILLVKNYLLLTVYQLLYY